MPVGDDQSYNDNAYVRTAKLVEREVPTPQEVGVDQVRLSSTEDSIMLTDSVEFIKRRTTQFYVPYKNLLLNPNFVTNLDDWTLVSHVNHDVDVEDSDEKIFLRGRTNSSAKLELTNTTGVGDTELLQDIGVDIGDTLSFEAWVNIELLTGNPDIRLLARVYDVNDNLLDTSSIVEQDAMTTDWTLLKVTGYDVPAAGRSITVSWTAPVSAQSITSYDIRYRTGTEAWEIIETGNTSTNYTITGLRAGTMYEIQVRANSTGGPGEWSASATILTDS